MLPVSPLLARNTEDWMVPTRDSETVPEWIDYASTEKKVPNFGIADTRRKPIRACTTTLNALGILHRPLGNSLGDVLSNSSPIQRWKAVVFCGRPRKFFTKSLAEIDPPGSSTVRR